MVISLAVAGLLVSASAFAQSFPSKPITIVAAYPLGGVTDVVARVLADGLGKRLGQPATVGNRTGAAGMIGASSVARAAARPSMLQDLERHREPELSSTLLAVAAMAEALHMPAARLQTVATLLRLKAMNLDARAASVHTRS